MHNILDLLVRKLKNDKKYVKLFLIVYIFPFLNSIEDFEYSKMIEMSRNELSDYNIDCVSSFLLGASKSKDGLTFEQLANVEQEKFNNLKIEEYIPYIFPYVGQNDPSFTIKDIDQFRKYEGKYSISKPTKAIVEKLLRKYNVNINTENDEIMVKILDIDEKELDYLSDILKRGYDFHNEIENDLNIILYLKNIMNQLDKIIYSTKEYNNGNDKVYEKIGKGGFGIVYKVEHNGMVMARKDIEIGSVNMDKVINEINIMKDLRNTNVLKCYDQIFDKKNGIFHIYTQYFKCDLSKKIKEKKKLNDQFSIYV